MTSPARPLWRNPGWLLFALLALAPPLALLLRPAPEPLPHLGRLPEFSVVDQSGEPLTRASFAGHVVVLDFIFTRCPDICPTLTAQMAALRDELPAKPRDGAPITFVSVSVDPGHDTPAVLAEYAAQYDANPQTWRFVNGDRDTVTAIAAGLVQGLTLSPGEGPAEVSDIMHGQRFLLIDPSASLRGAYETTPDGLEALADAARGLSAAGTDVRPAPAASSP